MREQELPKSLMVLVFFVENALPTERKKILHTSPLKSIKRLATGKLKNTLSSIVTRP